jgi:peptidoglycan-N-acetylglucosamine deacetylase
MRHTATRFVAAVLGALLAAPGASLAADDHSCAPGQGLGVGRVIEIDTSTGPLYGDNTKYQKQSSFLQPKEVVLTFDDGPMPAITRSILDTLDKHCTKATFFHVGNMATAYPGDVRSVAAKGHTIGTHTWSHPLNIRRLKPEAALEEVERGFAAVAAAAGQPIAPFFRFPGLSDNEALLKHLQTRGVGTFTVDVISNDSYIHDADKLVRVTLERVEARQGGIMLFHDIKSSTARALPVILTELKRRGYTVVHMRSKHPFVPDPKYGPQFANVEAKVAARPALVPFYAVAAAQTEVDQLAPIAKTFATPAPRHAVVAGLAAGVAGATALDGLGAAKAPRRKVKLAKTAKALAPVGTGWTTTIKPAQNQAPRKDRRAALVD